ncbi:MAG: hypothetical protein NVS1B10_06330 [Candidatus Saccharimonadales bacterium]
MTTKLLLVIALTLTLAACGSGSGAKSPDAVKPPIQPIGTTQTVHMLASYSAGTQNNYTYILPQSTLVTIPATTDLMITANATEFYHAYINIGPSVICDYTHPAMSNTYTTVSCNTALTAIQINTGDTVVVSVQNNAQVNATRVDAAVTLRY